MNKVVKMFLCLTVIGLLSGIALSLVYQKANPRILYNKEQELKAAIFVVLPEAKDYVLLEKGEPSDEDHLVVYKGVGDAGEPVGVAFKANGVGYAGNIGLMVGLNMDYLTLSGIRILDQLETPGLGNRIKEPEFEGQFVGIDIAPRIEYIKNRKPEKPNQIQAITGATISSDAVVKNINNAVAKVLKAFTREEVIKAVAPIPAKPATPATDDGVQTPAKK